MNTLRLLGVNLVGRQFDADQGASHYERNPDGYWEEPVIYRQGPQNRAFKRLSVGVAVKMDLRNLVAENQYKHWIEASPKLRALLVSIRKPCEQAHSEYLGASSALEPDERTRFLFTTNFLREYSEVLSKIQDVLGGELSPLMERTHVIDYSETAVPQSYVQRVISACGLEPNDSARVLAESNFKPQLYRVRESNLTEQELEWSRRLGAEIAYQALRGWKSREAPQ